MRPLRSLIPASLVASTATLGLAFSASVNAQASTASARCAPTGAHTLAADRAARAFSWRGSVYGCVIATGDRRKLGGAGFCNQPAGLVGPVRLSEALVAYAVKTCGVDTANSTVLVRNLARGPRLADVSATTLPLRAESFVTVTSLVLRSGGAAGWIAGVDSIGGGPRTTYEVHRLERDKGSLLDSGTAIRPSSLRLVGSSMTWRDGGAKRSAMLG